MMKNAILIIDFGSQVTQLIARRLREEGVYTEILPSTSVQGLEKEGRYPILAGLSCPGAKFGNPCRYTARPAGGI